MKVFGTTHPGLTREINEDGYLIKSINNDFHLLAVADGLGGEIAGEHASALALKEFATISPDFNDLNELMLKKIVKSDKDITEKVDKDQNLEGMGTTLTGVVIKNNNATWIHVGDSRLYLIRNEEANQITRDQNMAGFLVEEGEITPEEAQNHKSRHFLDQCIGCGLCEPDSGEFNIFPGDMLILTTDGLHNEISADVFLPAIHKEKHLEGMANNLVNLALESGGRDNITIIIARFGNP